MERDLARGYTAVPTKLGPTFPYPKSFVKRHAHRKQSRKKRVRGGHFPLLSRKAPKGLVYAKKRKIDIVGVDKTTTRNEKEEGEKLSKEDEKIGGGALKEGGGRV